MVQEANHMDVLCARKFYIHQKFTNLNTLTNSFVNNQGSLNDTIDSIEKSGPKILVQNDFSRHLVQHSDECRTSERIAHPCDLLLGPYKLRHFCGTNHLEAKVYDLTQANKLELNRIDTMIRVTLYPYYQYQTGVMMNISKLISEPPDDSTDYIQNRIEIRDQIILMNPKCTFKIKKVADKELTNNNVTSEQTCQGTENHSLWYGIQHSILSIQTTLSPIANKQSRDKISKIRQLLDSYLAIYEQGFTDGGKEDG